MLVLLCHLITKVSAVSRKTGRAEQTLEAEDCGLEASSHRHELHDLGLLTSLAVLASVSSSGAHQITVKATGNVSKVPRVVPDRGGDPQNGSYPITAWY